MCPASDPQSVSSQKSAQVHEDTSSKAYQNRYFILVIVLTGILMAVLDGNVVGIALPTITKFFAVDVALSQWTITGYLLTMTALLLVFGKISDLTGKVPMYIVGFFIFTVSSLACGLATGIYELIAFRVIQAIGGAMVAAIGGAILFMAFPPEERGRAMGFIGSTVAIGCILGPIMGGLMVDHLGWGSIFLINVPIGAVLLLFSLKYLKLEEQRHPKFTMDWGGSVSIIIAVVTLMLALSEIARSSAITPMLLAYTGIFTIALVAFCAVELRNKSPLIDLSLFKNGKFSLPLITLLINMIISLMISVITPFYFQGALGYTASQVGLVLFVAPVIMVIGSPICGWMYDRFPWRHYSAAGMLIIAASLFGVGYAVYRFDLPLAIVSLVVNGVGSALFQSPNNMEIMTALPRRMTAIASSTSAMVRNLGMSLGVSLGTILLTIQFAYANYSGPILKAEPGLLASATGNAIYLGAALCIGAMVISIIRNLDRGTAESKGRKG